MSVHSTCWPKGGHCGKWRLAAVAIALFLAVGCYSQDANNSQVVASVNGRDITLSQFNARAAFMGLGANPQVLTPELRKSVVDDLVKRELVLAYAAQMGIELDAAEADSLEMALRGDMDDEAFKTSLAVQGITYQQWKKELVQQGLMEKTLHIVTLPQAHVSAEEIKRYYLKKRDSFKRPEQIFAQHALLPTKELAQKLVDQVTAGADMAEAAAKLGAPLAEEGRPAWLSKGHMPPELEKKVFSLKAGQLAGPLYSPYGFHVVRVVDKRPSTELSLAQAAGEIQKRLAAERKEELAARWIAKSQQDAKVQQRESFIRQGSLISSGSPQ